MGTLHRLSDRSSPARCSWHEPRIVLDGFHALVHRECVVEANPFARVPHEIEGEPVMPRCSILANFASNEGERAFGPGQA